MIVSAEHASHLVPPDLASLGLSAGDLDGHEAWDPGAGAVATRIAHAFEVPLFLGRWSRLVADLNRPDTEPEVIPAVSYGLEVPGNRDLDPRSRAERIARFHSPYWRDVIGAIESAERPVFHLSIHSFTPEYRGEVRRVSIGVLIDPTRPLELEIAERLIRSLTASGWIAGVNEPYDGRAPALTTSCRERFSASDYAGVEIEINQRHLGALDQLTSDLISALES